MVWGLGIGRMLPMPWCLLTLLLLVLLVLGLVLNMLPLRLRLMLRGCGLRCPTMWIQLQAKRSAVPHEICADSKLPDAHEPGHHKQAACPGA